MPREIEKYIAAQQENREKLARMPVFQELAPLVDALYRQSVKLTPQNVPAIFGQIMLVCHSSFLSAIVLLIQAQPSDAAPITRRAIEAIRLAAALKEDSSALERWVNFEKRHPRWLARQAGQRPERLPSFSPHVKNEIVKGLMDTWGILSDAAVHFTPEFFSTQSWTERQTTEGREMYLNYFHEDVREIERDLNITTGTHAKILRVFDWCFDQSFSTSPEWSQTMQELYARGERVNRERAHVPETTDRN